MPKTESRKKSTERIQRHPISEEKKVAGLKIINAHRSGLIDFADERDRLLAGIGLEPEDFGIQSYKSFVKEQRAKQRAELKALRERNIELK